MDFPELHRRYLRVPEYEYKQPHRPGGLMRRGDLIFRPYTAYLLASGKLNKTLIWEKPDQNFGAYATPFEWGWSKLLSLRNSLDPVVDVDLTVIGHVGTVDCRSVLVPRVHPFSRTTGKDIPASLVRSGIAVFVGNEPPDDSWERFARAPRGEGIALRLVTGVDGRVLAVLDVRPTGAGAVAEDFSPLDVIMIVKGLAGLGSALAKKLVSGLARKSASPGAVAGVLFAGPTRELAMAASRASAPPLQRTTAYIAETGMTAKHFAAFQAAAREANVIAVVRNTNPASMKLIELGCPGKPMFFKFHTSPTTGVVMAETADDVAKAWAREYFVVGADRIPRRVVMRNGRRVTETLDVKGAFWKIEKGQVIDPLAKKPLVGDYDLMGVIDPSAAGRNVALVTRNKGEAVSDITSPVVKRFTENVNVRLDRARVLHGAQDQFASFRGGAAAFHPDGTVTLLRDEGAVRQFYEQIGRQTIKGSYTQPAGVKSVDELAARRAARGATASK